MRYKFSIPQTIMPRSGKPYTRQQARQDRACLMIAAAVFALTFAVSLALLRLSVR